MAIKKPLCLYGGQPAELKTGDTMEGATAAGGLAPGVIVRSGKTAPAGTIRCNGALLSQAGYPDLYAAIGDDFIWIANRYNNGKPHRQQYGFNMTNPGNFGWSAAPSGLPGALAYSQAIVTNSRVYLLGGYNGAAVSTVYTAPINADGTLGAWTVATSLPAALHVHQAIMTNSRVYLLGGHSGSAPLSTVYTAPINADGTLGAWTTATSLPAALSSSQAIVTNSRVYLLGGWSGSHLSLVYTAPINADGTLGAWTTATSLPAALSSSQAIVTNSRVYLLGGYDSAGAATAAVYTAPIHADGTLGAWTVTTSLPAALGSSQAVVTNSRVYLLGGVGTSGITATVYTAPINADGTLGAWTTATSLAVVLASYQAIVTNSRVYLLGGQTPSGSVSAAYYGAFTGGLNNYLNMTFSRDDISTGFFIPDTRREDAMYPDESCRSYIAY